VRSGVSAKEMHPRMAIDRAFLPLALSEATPLDRESQEFKSFHRYFHQSRPGRIEANDLPEAGNREIVIEGIFRISPHRRAGRF
jgi:hypothetical protein